MEDRISNAVHGGHDLEERTIWLFAEEIQYETAAKFIPTIRMMDQQNQSPMRVVLCSGGGYEDPGYGIYDTLMGCRSHVTIEVVGDASSIAAAILQAGDLRLIHPTAKLLLHLGSMTLDPGDVDQAKVVEHARGILRSADQYHRILASRSRVPISKIQEMCRGETVLEAEEAVRIGLADQVIPHVKQHASPRKRRRRA